MALKLDDVTLWQIFVECPEVYVKEIIKLLDFYLDNGYIAYYEGTHQFKVTEPCLAIKAIGYDESVIQMLISEIKLIRSSSFRSVLVLRSEVTGGLI